MDIIEKVISRVQVCHGRATGIPLMLMVGPSYIRIESLDAFVSEIEDDPAGTSLPPLARLFIKDAYKTDLQEASYHVTEKDGKRCLSITDQDGKSLYHFDLMPTQV